MLGGDCSPCCSGWYCCPDPQCALDTVNAITVAITTSNTWWVRNYRKAAPCLSGAFDQYTHAIPVQSINGTFQLAKQSPTLWSVTLPADPIGCAQPAVSLYLSQALSTSGYWRLSVTFPAYYWYRATMNGSLPFKTAAQMQCVTTPAYSGTACSRYEAEYEQYAHEPQTALFGPRHFDCEPKPDQALFSGQQLAQLPQPPILVDLGGSPPTPFDVDTSSGSLAITVAVQLS
jgi:hypothetical protein